MAIGQEWLWDALVSPTGHLSLPQVPAGTSTLPASSQQPPSILPALLQTIQYLWIFLRLHEQKHTIISAKNP